MWQGLVGEKERGKRCNYVAISKNNENYTQDNQVIIYNKIPWLMVSI